MRDIGAGPRPEADAAREEGAGGDSRRDDRRARSRSGLNRDRNSIWISRAPVDRWGYPRRGGVSGNKAAPVRAGAVLRLAFSASSIVKPSSASAKNRTCLTVARVAAFPAGRASSRGSVSGLAGGLLGAAPPASQIRPFRVTIGQSGVKQLNVRQDVGTQAGWLAGVSGRKEMPGLEYSLWRP